MKGDARFWSEEGRGRWARCDGACVVLQAWAPKRQWIAFRPGSEQNNYLSMAQGSRGLRGPRRWKTPEAAMRAVDKEWP